MARPQDQSLTTIHPTLDSLWQNAHQFHNPQVHSHLFSTLPAELRNNIFSLALEEYSDLSRAYPRDTYYWRPSFRGPPRIDIDLLQTCKLVWLETRALPMRALADSPMVFFVASRDWRPPEYKCDGSRESRCKGPCQTSRSRKFSEKQWAVLKTIRIFFQDPSSYNISTFFSGAPLHPSTVIFTRRYTDWFEWEVGHPLLLKTNSDTILGGLPASVTKVVVEFEVRDQQEQELRDLLQKVMGLEERLRWKRDGAGDLEDLRILGAENGDREMWKHVKEKRWVGPTKFMGEEFEHHPEGDDMVYFVLAVTWELPGRMKDPSRIVAALI